LPLSSSYAHIIWPWHRTQIPRTKGQDNVGRHARDLMNGPVFFQVEYAGKNNRGAAVGFDDNGLLVLRKVAEKEWALDSLPKHEIMRIRVRRYWSLGLIVLGLGSAALGILLFLLVLWGAPLSFRVMLLSVPLFGFAWYALGGSRRIRIDFEMMDRRLRYSSHPGSYSETLAALQALEEWSAKYRVPCSIEFTRGET
jgi:hypothetical protein